MISREFGRFWGIWARIELFKAPKNSLRKCPVIRVIFAIFIEIANLIDILTHEIMINAILTSGGWAVLRRGALEG